MRIHIILPLVSVTLSASEPHTHFSLQGYTGVINTPNAQVLENGEAALHYNNQADNHLLFYDNEHTELTEENYVAGMGFLPYFEASGRLVETNQRAIRDLSANVKFQVPIGDTFLPSIAVGIQDLGSSSSFYKNHFVVMDKSFGGVRASVGYGNSGDNKAAQRMDGVFGALEYQPIEWLSVMAEHDGQENHAGVRLSTPRGWLGDMRVDGMVVQNLTESDTSFAVSVSLPLLYQYQKKRYLPNDHASRDNNSIKALSAEKHTESKETLSTGNIESERETKHLKLFSLQKKLISFGFENVMIGEYADTLYVACENTMFDQNELDALGYVLGIITESSMGYKNYALTLLKSNLEMITALGTMNVFQAYVHDPSSVNYIKLERDMQFTRNFDASKVITVAKRANSSFLKPRVELSPGLVTTVGTEVGVFDYLVSLRSNAYSTLYDGLMVSAMYETPLFNSENFDEGKVYYNTYRTKMDSRLVNAMVHQTLHYDQLLNMTSIGQFRTDYMGVMNQSSYISESGEHGLNLKLGSFEHNDLSNDQRDLYIGSYRYFYEPLELFTEVSYGKYWNQDTGAAVSFKRFFNDTALALYYKNTTSDDYVGFRLSLPLTLRKTHKAYYAQVKGKSDFNYGIRTTVNREDGSNQLNPAGGIDPRSDFELNAYYLNRDRLNPAYIRGNIKRLREAYLTYR